MGTRSTLIHAAIKLLEQVLQTIEPLNDGQIMIIKDDMLDAIAVLKDLLDESQPKLQEDLGFE